MVGWLVWVHTHKHTIMGRMSHGNHIEIKGQICGVYSLLSPYMGSRNWTQIASCPTSFFNRWTIPAVPFCLCGTGSRVGTGDWTWGSYMVDKPSTSWSTLPDPTYMLHKLTSACLALVDSLLLAFISNRLKPYPFDLFKRKLMRMEACVLSTSELSTSTTAPSTPRDQ